MITEAYLPWRYLDGEIIMPWYAKPALEWLKQQDTSQWNVFEYGCGYSTIWWRLNCEEVISVDNNEVWAKAMNTSFAGEKVGYTTYITSVFVSRKYDPEGRFDCIVIDGEWRDECTLYAIECLKPGGYLIVDNYEQPSVGYDFTKTNSLLQGWEKQVHKQPNHSDWCTAIFRKPL